jgi:serine/threonine protein kinase
MIERSGQKLGNYRVIRSIGQGGFADIYLGEHIYLKTLVAIKVLKAKVANEDELEDFLWEARTIAHLVHPHIIRVLDFGIDDRTPFLVMDYAPNGTLHQRHRGMRVSLGHVVSYTRQVAAALQYAHDAKLIHRDVKPANMLLGRNNDVLLSDFGIALITQGSYYQDTQDVIGTLAYMAPEQIQGKAHPASDQYSLGIVVYEWLSGEQPFRGSFTDLYSQQMYAPPPALRGKIPGIAPEVEQVIMKALAKDPTERFGCVQAFACALEQASRTTEAMMVVPKNALPSLSSVMQAQVAGSVPMPMASRAILPVQSDEENVLQISAAPTVLNTALDVDASSISPVTGSSAGEARGQVGYGEKIGAGRLVIRQVMVMIVGVVLCAGLGLVSDQGLPSSISFIPEFLVAVIFGVFFGPLVGLVCGGVGISILEAVSGPVVYVGFALVGLVAGLAKVIVPGGYNTFLKFMVAEIFGAMGILMSLGLIFYCTYFLYALHPSLNILLNYLIIYGVRGVLATLIILPFVLCVNNVVVRCLRRRRVD